MNFATLQGLTIPEGVVTQIADASGRLLWALSGGKAVLEVMKYTSDTYANETTYTGEQFILLDIYPKTNGTVTVTYGGLTKTITDTSGAEDPNAQQVVFGTFNGVTHDSTPDSGTLTIKGDFYAYGQGSYAKTSKDIAAPYCQCVTSIVDIAEITVIPQCAFGNSATEANNLNVETVEIPDAVLSIGERAFAGSTALQTVIIGKGVTSIGAAAFCASFENSLTTIKMLGTTPPILEDPLGTGLYSHFNKPGDEYCYLKEIIVPKGCVNAYMTATGWSVYARYIVEAS